MKKVFNGIEMIRRRISFSLRRATFKQIVMFYFWFWELRILFNSQSNDASSFLCGVSRNCNLISTQNIIKDFVQIDLVNYVFTQLDYIIININCFEVNNIFQISAIMAVIFKKKIGFLFVLYCALKLIHSLKFYVIFILKEF